MKMRATARMPRGVLNRYRTRMLAADDTFDEPSPKWSRFYAQHGWAVEAVDEPTPAPRPRGRPPKAATPEAAGGAHEPTRDELLEEAKELGVELPSGYVRKDDLAELVEEAKEKEDME